METIKNISVIAVLRGSLGLMYLYSGFDIFLHPQSWHWALPFWLKNVITSVIPLNTYLMIQGASEVVLALILLSWFLSTTVVRWASFISFLEMLGILVLAFLPWSAANFTITFRDIGLLGASFALFLLLTKKQETT